MLSFLSEQKSLAAANSRNICMLQSPISELSLGLTYYQSASLLSVILFLTLLNRLNHIYFSDIKEEKVLVETL